MCSTSRAPASRRTSTLTRFTRLYHPRWQRQIGARVQAQRRHTRGATLCATMPGHRGRRPEDALGHRVTYISLELGHLIVSTTTPDGHMRTYGRNHITLAYLAATDQRWKDTMTEKLQEMLLNFMRYSEGGIVIGQRRWMARARARIYCRQVSNFEDDPGLRGWIKTSIFNLDWETAHSLATSDLQSGSQPRSSGSTPAERR